MRLLVPAAALLLAAGCVSNQDSAQKNAAATPTAGASQATAAATAAAQEELKQKAEDAAFQLELANVRLQRAQMDAEQQQTESGLATTKAQLELRLAQKALDHYVKVEMPAKRSRGELDLTQGKDFLTEQEEELAQLELMYKNDDLGDKTKEIVLARSKRRLDRARQSIALQTKELDDLLTVQQPDQKEKLELAVKDKENDLHRAEFAAKTAQIDKDLAVRTQAMEVEKQKREVEKARKAVTSPAPTGRADAKTPASSVAAFLFGMQ